MAADEDTFLHQQVSGHGQAGRGRALRVGGKKRAKGKRKTLPVGLTSSCLVNERMLNDR